MSIRNVYSHWNLYALDSVVSMRLFVVINVQYTLLPCRCPSLPLSRLLFSTFLRLRSLCCFLFFVYYLYEAIAFLWIVLLFMLRSAFFFFCWFHSLELKLLFCSLRQKLNRKRVEEEKWIKIKREKKTFYYRAPLSHFFLLHFYWNIIFCIFCFVLLRWHNKEVVNAYPLYTHTHTHTGSIHLLTFLF